MSSHPPTPLAGVPFSFFSSLVREIAKIPSLPSTSRPPRPSWSDPHPAQRVFQNWVNELRSRFPPLPQGTTATCFRLLFPEFDVPRKYEIQESRMSSLLAECLGIESKTFERWSLEQPSSCLGQDLRIVLEHISPDPDPPESPLTIAQLDGILDELASKSGWSHTSIRSKTGTHLARTRKDIIRSLFRSLSPEDAGIVVQIILKDLRPLLYPLTEVHYTTALTKYDSASVEMLTKEQAMNVWDPTGSMLKFYRVRSSLNDAAAFFETPVALRTRICPVVGSLLAIPKSEKGRGPADALSRFGSSDIIWAETKYDGERAQIHVQKRDGRFHITIFSKSGRDSTADRYAVHDTIRNTLGLTDGSTPKIKDNVVLDAEMVACKGSQIEEFWRIRHLVQTTGRGIVKARGRWPRPDDEIRNESMASEADKGMALALVFFDILVLDSITLLHKPYSHRRQLLHSLITTEPGYAMLADRFLIDMRKSDPTGQLRRIFSSHIATFQEGLVLKADESQYNDFRKPWVKLKKDYIPGYGDTLDFVLVGAGWEKDRARMLRVPRGTYTTFYIGVRCATSSQPAASSSQAPVHVFFTAEYGLNRTQLEELNFLIKSSGPLSYPPKPSALGYSLTVRSQLRPEPDVILQEPLAVELFGAGFTKAPGSEFYELRFPRIVKYYRSSERKWTETVDSTELHKIACAVVGRDRTDKDIDDWGNTLFGKPASPSVRSTVKRKALTQLWDSKLAVLDGKRPRAGSPSESPPLPSSIKNPETSTPVTSMSTWNPPQLAARALVPRALTQNVEQKGDSYLSVKKKQPSLRPVWESSPLPLAWFVEVSARSPRRCDAWNAWKGEIPRERRLHSLESLVFGCGWQASEPKYPRPREGSKAEGRIFVDQCDSEAKVWVESVIERLEDLRTSGLKGGAILVLFSTSPLCRERAVVYARNGDPTQVLRVLTYPDLPAPTPGSVNIRFRMSPINPADINVIEGVYPSKPDVKDLLHSPGSPEKTLFVGGNEGLAQVIAVGQGVDSLAVGDWVIMTKQQAGTWATGRNVTVQDILKVPEGQTITEAQAATLTVNPPTAWNMLHDFVELQPGDFVIQNGANSAVGQAVIQIAATRGLKTINLVRDRPNLESLRTTLYTLGATHVLTYEELADPSTKSRIKEWTGGKSIRLGLNCVGGKETTSMARFLGTNAHLVSYGAMAKQPLTLPVSLFIFKNLTCHGFWQSRWYKERSTRERENLMQNLVQLMKEAKLAAPEHEVISIAKEDSDEAATTKVREVMKALAEGRYGKKVLFRLDR